MASSEFHINLSPNAPQITPDRPCWAVYEHWVSNEKGRRLKPGVYWHGYKRLLGDDESDDEQSRPTTDEWISTPVTVIARTTNTDDGCEGRLLRLLTDNGHKEWIIAIRGDRLGRGNGHCLPITPLGNGQRLGGLSVAVWGVAGTRRQR